MRFLITVLMVLLSVSTNSFAEGKSYVEDKVKIISIDNSHRQAEAWGMCAAAYDTMSEILRESSPAQAKQLADLSNGAEMAVIISMVASELSEDITPEKFNNLWNFSKISGGEIPKAMRTALMADLEADTSKGKDKFLSDIGRTVAVCAGNLEGQQAYIDIWRDLAKSGLLTIPSE